MKNCSGAPCALQKEIYKRGDFMKLGLALSGGGIRGIAHAGVIKALEENNIQIDYIGGTSSGSMISALYALGYRPDEIYNLFKKYASTIVKLNSNIIRKEIKNFIINHKIKCKGINTGKFIEEIFNKLAKQKQIDYMEQIKIPIIMPTVDISTGKEYVFTSIKKNKKNYITDIEVGKAVRASSSFPGIYEPVEYKNKILIDGGVLNNIPVQEVKEIGADKVISVKFNSDTVKKDSNAIDIVMKVSDIMTAKIAEENLAQSEYTISIPTDSTGILDVKKIDYCYKSGYDETIKKMQEIRKII